MSHDEFPAAGPVTASVKVHAGDIEILAEERDTVAVTVEPNRPKVFGFPADPSRAMADNTRVEMVGNTLIVGAPAIGVFGFLGRSPSVTVTIRVPLGSTADVKTVSAGVRLAGQLAAARVATASGDLVADVITGDADVRTASGGIDIGAVGQRADLASASGDIEVDTVGAALNANTASGDVRIGSIGGMAKIKSASGSILVSALHAGDTQISSASGNVQVGIARGTTVLLDVSTISGRTTSDLDTTAAPPTDEPTRLNLRARTVSGNVHIFRAASASAAPSDPVPSDRAPSDPAPSDPATAGSIAGGSIAASSAPDDGAAAGPGGEPVE